jgi:hypothetical protein
VRRLWWVDARHQAHQQARRPIIYYVCNNWRVDGACDKGLSLPLAAL